MNSNLAGTTPGNFILILFYTFSAYADVLYIFPNKRKKISFDSKRDEILRHGVAAVLSGRPSDSKNNKGKQDAGDGMSAQDKIDEKFIKSLLEEEKKDYGNVDLSKKLVDSIPTIKKNLKFFDLDRVKLEIA